MKKALIIGMGNIGYRHFQALHNLKNKIFLIDPKISKLSLEKFYAKNKKNKHIFYLKNYSKLPKVIDLAIIATTADKRLDCLNNLIKNTKIKNIILEKILFNKIKSYKEAKYFINNKTNIWVNSLNRTYPITKLIKKKNKNFRLKYLSVKGNEWGLACNFIHFLDLINYFNYETKYSIVKNNLKKIIKTKRKRFIDFLGNIKIKSEHGTNIFFESKKGKMNYQLKLIFNNYTYLINEIKGEVIEINKKLKIRKKYIYKTPLVSELTKKFAKQIYKNNRCELTDLETSIKLHFPLIKSFCKSYKKIKKIKKINSCPIT